MRRTILATVLLCLTCLLSASPIHHFYVHYTSPDGLPVSLVTAVSQDEYGRLWVGTNAGTYYYAGDKFRPFMNEEYKKTSSAGTMAIASDKDGNIWMSSRNSFGRYDIKTDSYKCYHDLDETTVDDIDVAPDGTIWLTSASGIWRYEPEADSFRKVVDSRSFTPFRSVVLSNGNLVFTASNNFVYVYDTVQDNLRAVATDSGNAGYRFIEAVSPGKVIVSDIEEDVYEIDINNGKRTVVIDAGNMPKLSEVHSLMVKDGEYWIGTTSGLVIKDPVSGEIEIQYNDMKEEFSLSANIHCFFEDSMGNAWAGTYSGLYGWLSYEDDFHRFRSGKSSNSLTGKSVRSLEQDTKGRIWIGSAEGNLCCYDPETGIFTDHTDSSGLPAGVAVTDIEAIEGNLWITSYGGGIVVYDPISGKQVGRYHLSSDSCMSILRFSNGDIFVGTIDGLFRYDQKSDSFRKLEAVGTGLVHALVEYNTTTLLVGNYSMGMGMYNVRTGAYRMIQEFPKKGVVSMVLDRNSDVWAATIGTGLVRMRIRDDGNVITVKQYGMAQGFPSESITSVSIDNNGLLWVGTHDGLVEFDSAKEKVRNTYMRSDNVVGANFAYGGSLVSGTGLIYLATADGFMSFRPEGMKSIFEPNPLVITDISVGTMGGKRSISEKNKSVFTSKSIKVKQRDAAYLSISFSPLVYGSPNKNIYDCSMKANGFNSRLETDECSIAYTSLRPGKYTFRVNYSGNEDSLKGATMDFVITAPWFSSQVATLLYLVLIVFMGWWFMRYYNRRRIKEERHKMELLEANKEKDMAREKMEFFTTLAHEIRTPVTVLQMLLDKVSPDGKNVIVSSESLSSMRINVDRLMKLCTDLLDFRKVESGQSNIVFASEDIVGICRKAVASFESAAKGKGIDFIVDLPDQAVNVVCGSGEVESIVCNLLSNAVKYCRASISIVAKEIDDIFVVRVINDGEPVPESEKERIFDAFYQSHVVVKHGTGLGLAYSRQLAELHKGSLVLESSVDGRTVFKLELPKGEAKQNVSSAPVSADEAKVLGFDEDAALETESGSRSLILVVEDNESMRDLIAENLSSKYDVITASNGAEAFEIVKTRSIDLVVSDIMMPVMDGCELCNAIKEDVQFSHIPVLLLTAAVGIETHIRSLKSGADGYIEKPFTMEVLEANVTNLFKNKEIRSKQMASSPLSPMNISAVSKVEQEFMKKLRNYILDHIIETDLTITSLSSAMAVSKSTLNRKVKANTGLTVNEYVRVCRLKKAVELFSENNYRINEVAYLVGYSSPSYFTQSFQKQFGCLPSEFVKNDSLQ